MKAKIDTDTCPPFLVSSHFTQFSKTNKQKKQFSFVTFIYTAYLQKAKDGKNFSFIIKVHSLLHTGRQLVVVWKSSYVCVRLTEATSLKDPIICSMPGRTFIQTPPLPVRDQEGSKARVLLRAFLKQWNVFGGHQNCKDQNSKDEFGGVIQRVTQLFKCGCKWRGGGVGGHLHMWEMFRSGKASRNQNSKKIKQPGSGIH